LDILEELGISDFPTTVRINKNTDTKLLTRIAEVIRYGGGVIAVYNEDLIIESLVDYGYELSEARKFANDGCWEIQIPGKTYFTYIPFDALQILQQRTLDNYSGKVNFSDFDSLYKAFVDDLKNKVTDIVATKNEHCFVCTAVPTKDWKWEPSTPCTVVSLFEQGCIKNGLSYLEGGPVYNVASPHIGGLPDVVNSLYAIKKLVFDEQKVTFVQLMQLLKSNWGDNEALRQYALNKYSYFGNDNDEVDSIAKNIISDFADICDNLESGYKTPAGVSTFGRQLEWSGLRMATAYGKKAHEVLAGNFSPTPGTDKEGATAIIKSYCKADLKRTVSGAALDIKLLPSTVNDENGTEAIVSLIKGFVTLGGHFMQLDIADTQLLKEAQKHPEEYQNLSVRVSGWNARFVTLNREWQDMIIAQTGSEL
jgi:formate C-acetyltransferase